MGNEDALFKENKIAGDIVSRMELSKNFKKINVKEIVRPIRLTTNNECWNRYLGFHKKTGNNIENLRVFGLGKMNTNNISKKDSKSGGEIGNAFFSSNIKESISSSKEKLTDDKSETKELSEFDNLSNICGIFEDSLTLYQKDLSSDFSLQINNDIIVTKLKEIKKKIEKLIENKEEEKDHYKFNSEQDKILLKWLENHDNRESEYKDLVKMEEYGSLFFGFTARMCYDHVRKAKLFKEILEKKKNEKPSDKK